MRGTPGVCTLTAMERERAEFTSVLQRAEAGDAGAVNELMPLVYEDLRKVAAGLLQSERKGHTLQPTALVNEVYVRLVRSSGEPDRWNNREHFFRAAAQAMRRILIDHARAKNAEIRGGGVEKFPLEGFEIPATREFRADQHMDVERLLAELERQEPRWRELLDGRYYLNVPIADMAARWGMDARTVEKELRFARAWVRKRLEEDGASRPAGDHGEPDQ